MKLNTKLGAFVVVGAMAVAVPAAADPGHQHQSGGGGSHPSQSHRCQPHNRAYVESGTVDGTTPSALAQNADGTWSGTLVVDVTSSNHLASADQGTTVTYTFDNAQLEVVFGNGASGFTGGEAVKLIGKEASVGKNCPAPSTAPAPEFRRLVVQPAGSSSSDGSSSPSES